MTPKHEELLDILEPLALAARRDIYKSLFAFRHRIYAAPDAEHDASETIEAIQWHPVHGYTGESVAFALVAERLAEWPR